MTHSQRKALGRAWTRLMLAYLVALVVSLILGLLLVRFGLVDPRRLFELSGTRISRVLPLFEAGMRHGVDLGLLLFVWNSIAAAVTMAFIHLADWFDPRQTERSPRALRKVFCGRRPMKLLCYLPDCKVIDQEPLRRAYIWLMVPWLGLILLGLESGLQVATAAELTGSMLSSILALATHGVIEIPAFALAGAVPFSAHQIVKKMAGKSDLPAVFEAVAQHRQTLAFKRLLLSVVGALLVAGLIEAHLTPLLMRLAG